MAIVSKYNKWKCLLIQWALIKNLFAHLYTPTSKIYLISYLCKRCVKLTGFWTTMNETYQLKLFNFISAWLSNCVYFSINFVLGRGQLQIKHESRNFDKPRKDFNSLFCSVAGPGDKIYTWYHNGNLITTKYLSSGFLATNTDTLVVRKFANRQYQGTYQLFVSSPFGRIFCGKINVIFKGTDTNQIHPTLTCTWIFISMHVQVNADT